MPFFLSKHGLSTWIDVPETDAFADLCTRAGHEVDGIETLELSAGVIIGEISTVTKHPNADKLNVCQVQLGDQSVSIVCGCPTVATGLKVAVATVGTTLANGLTIKPVKLRGEPSEGMLCSLSELGLATDSAGIVHLPADAPVGQPLAPYLGLPDAILKCDLTPNRGDCLSLLGLARELVAFGCQKKPDWPQPAALPARAGQYAIALDSPACPYYALAELTFSGPVPPSPLWLVEQLRRAGLASQGLCVDVTQYVMLELGQPLHAFDRAAWQGEQVVVRQAQAGESMTLLDGRVINLSAEDCVIADQNNIQALAGVMGGQTAGVTPTTQSLLLESAHFDSKTLAYTGRRHRIQSEAATRFERGCDPKQAATALARAVELLVRYGGAECVAVSYAGEPPVVPSHQLPADLPERMLGFPVSDTVIDQSLTAFGAICEPVDGGWRITPPSYREDWRIAEDSVEEIFRWIGYDRLPTVWPTVTVTGEGIGRQSNKSLASQFWLNRGWDETITYSFIEGEKAALFSTYPDALQLTNPISPRMAVMRPQLISGLCETLAYNLRRQHAQCAFFEVGRAFDWQNNQPVEVEQLAGIVVAEGKTSWQGSTEAFDFYRIKGECLAFCQAMGWSDVRCDAADIQGYHPGMAVRFFQGDRCIGQCGALHPRVQKIYQLPAAFVFSFELEAADRVATRYQPIGKFPGIRRDLSFWVPREMTYQQLEKVIKSHCNEFFQSVEIIDFYQNEKQALKTSITVALYCKHPSRTLVDEEVNALVSSVVASLEKNHQVELRK